MKRILSFVAVVSLVVAAVALAKSGDEKAEKASHHSTASMKAGTWTGEILDAGCYIGHGAMGAKHAECGLKCAASGMPLMLLGKDAKAVLLTPNHDNPDAYNQLKTMVGSMATVTGTLAERGGVKGIDVTGVTAVAATTTESK
jgi:hypothetical protein